MSEMIERVSRALFDHFQAKNPTLGATFEGIYPEVRAEMDEIVRVVVGAIREPTVAMEHRAESELSDYYDGDHLGFGEIPRAYRAMIDAILDPTTTEGVK